MSTDQPDEAVIGSYVFHKEKSWNVSTIYRQCSSPYYDGMYYETLVWDWDSEKKDRGRLVHQGEGLNAHFEICRTIISKGAFWDQVEEG